MVESEQDTPQQAPVSGQRPTLAQAARPAHPPTLARRVEEASLNAWPAMHQILLDGWLLRFSKGFTKRANCIVPLYPSLTPHGEIGALEARVRYCENLYAREKLQTIFRLTSLPGTGALDPLEQLLHRRGYQATDETLVLTRPLPQPASKPGPHAPWPDRFQLLPLDDWVSVYTELTGMPAHAAALHRATLQGIQTRCAFAALGGKDGWVACGLAVLEQELLGLFDIVTSPKHRKRGHGSRIVSALLDWGADGGAQRAYLQMVAANKAAARLYERLDFEVLYNYQYRVSG